jgi:hypothetical protein
MHALPPEIMLEAIRSTVILPGVDEVAKPTHSAVDQALFRLSSTSGYPRR